MAFVHRTERERCWIGGVPPASFVTAAANVAPGSYDVLAGERRLLERTKALSKAPFSSTSRRGSATGKPTLATPGPGAYDDAQREAQRGAAGPSSSFASSSKRMQPPPGCEDLPGPGAYGMPAPTMAAAPRRAAPKRDSVARDAVPGLRQADTVPSIPSGDRTFGYVRSKDGSLRPRKKVRAPSSPGAGQSHTDWSRERRGIDFGRQLSRERLLALQRNETPGPGQYDIVKEPRKAGSSGATSPTRYMKAVNPALVEYIRPSGHSAFASQSRRAAAGRGAADTPGPGAYDTVKAAQEQWARRGGCNGAAGGARHFGSTVERFPSKKREDAPAFYYDPMSNSSFEACRRSSIWRRGASVPFASKAPRGATAKATDTGPDVGAYNIPGMADELKLKMSMAPKKGDSAFGSTARRFHDPNQVERGNPGLLGSFRMVQTGNDGKRLAPRRKMQPFKAPESKGGCSSVFRSRTSRWSGQGGAAHADGPSPGDYDVTRASAIAAAVERPGRGLMDSRAERFTGAVPGSTAGRAEDDVNVGPGAYNTNVSTLKIAKRRSSPAPAQAARADSLIGARRDETPGPGHYDFADEGSMLSRPTFNLTIAEEEHRALVRKGLV